MNDLPAVAAETKNTTTVTILHVIVAKNGLYVLGLPRDSPLLAVTDEREESGGKTGCFSDLSNAIFPRSPSLILSLPLFIIVLNAELGRRVSWKILEAWQGRKGSPRGDLI